MAHKNGPLRVALVGLGEAAEAHAEALAAHARLTLVAGVDRLAGPRKAFAEAQGCPTVPSVAALLGTTEVDAAVVCTPTATHAELVEELLAGGLHVLCEAPVALTSLEAGRLHEIARNGGRVLMAASHLRFAPDLAELRARLRDGAIGRPVRFEITPRTVAMDVEDTAELQVRTDLGTLGRIALSWCFDAPDDTLVLVHGTEGTARVASDGVHVRRVGESGWTRSGVGLDEGSARRAELDGFLTCIRSGKHQRCCGTSLPVLGLIERAYATERTGTWSWRTAKPAQVARR